MACGGVPVPKPEPMKRTEARKDREDAKRLKAFRLAVWAREQDKLPWNEADPVKDWARCQHCNRAVWIDAGPYFGEVHHRIPRSICTSAQRYDPANGVLLCRTCHQAAQEHRITI